MHRKMIKNKLRCMMNMARLADPTANFTSVDASEIAGPSHRNFTESRPSTSNQVPADGFKAPTMVPIKSRKSKPPKKTSLEEDKNENEETGLKTSRSGRVVKPILAAWTGERIVYDVEGNAVGLHHSVTKTATDKHRRSSIGNLSRMMDLCVSPQQMQAERKIHTLNSGKKKKRLRVIVDSDDEDSGSPHDRHGRQSTGKKRRISSQSGKEEKLEAHLLDEKSDDDDEEEPKSAFASGRSEYFKAQSKRNRRNNQQNDRPQQSSGRHDDDADEHEEDDEVDFERRSFNSRNKTNKRSSSKSPRKKRPRQQPFRNPFDPKLLLRKASDDTSPTENNNKGVGGGNPVGSGGGNNENGDGTPNLTKSISNVIEQKLIDIIESEILTKTQSVNWDDISGLDGAKAALKEIIILPMIAPSLFDSDIVTPPRGVLLFGPPGTGKTMIGKCVASQCKATFFNIAASSLSSKWVGEGEKLVQAMFSVARSRLPAVIFIDDVDSLLSNRSSGEHESSRRIKNEFLSQMEGIATNAKEKLLVLGTTNRPQELDDAARGRFTKRISVGLPDEASRKKMIQGHLANRPSDLSEEALLKIAQKADGFTGADMRNLCHEAAMGPIRKLPLEQVQTMDFENGDQIPSIGYNDFKAALRNVKPSVADSDLVAYKEWNDKYGVSIRDPNLAEDDYSDSDL